MHPWVEITLYLPATLLTPQAKGYLRVVNELRTRYLSVTGSFVPGEYDQLPTVARYVITADGPVVARTEMVFTIRLPGSLDDPGLIARLKEMRELVENIYKEAGAVDEEVLCTVRQVYELPR